MREIPNSLHSSAIGSPLGAGEQQTDSLYIIPNIFKGITPSSLEEESVTKCPDEVLPMSRDVAFHWKLL